MIDLIFALINFFIKKTQPSLIDWSFLVDIFIDPKNHFLHAYPHHRKKIKQKSFKHRAAE